MRILVFLLSIFMVSSTAYANEAVISDVVEDSSSINFASDVVLEDYERSRLEEKLVGLQDQLRTQEVILKKKSLDADDIAQRLEDSRRNTLTIEGQIRNIDAEYDRVKEDMTYLDQQIAMREITVRLLEDQVYHQSVSLVDKAQALESLLHLLYEQTRMTDFERLFVSDTISEQLRDSEFVYLIEDQLHTLYEDLVDRRNVLGRNRLSLRKEREHMIDLRHDLELVYDNLELQQQAKRDLLARLNITEQDYQDQLVAARARQRMIDSEIRSMETDLIVYARDRGVSLPTLSGGGSYRWPVDPSAGIVAGFMDPQYQQVFGVPHYGLGIRVAHGTPVVATADGIVMKVRDGGMGYSYLVIGHRDGMSSVYGYLSGFAVSEGDQVSSGSLIGWSGGTPGSAGAGWMTTGAQLRFEIRKNGVPVDPHGYL